MQFIFSEKKSVPRITFVEGTDTRLVERDGLLTISIGYGEKKECTTRKVHPLLRKAVRVAREQKIDSFSIDLSEPFFSLVDLPAYERGRLLAENMLMANYEFTRYKSEKPPYTGLKEVYLLNTTTEDQHGVLEGSVVGKMINWSRDLANTPGGDMTPTVLSEAARVIGKEKNIQVTILEKTDIEKMGMGLILGVDKGSNEPLKFIVMEYWGSGKGSEAPIVLVGKGITFDTGGINLKPGESMIGMNQDMTGGATVMATISICAELGLKKNIVAIVPAVENAVSGSAYRPGDVLTSLSGKTVEVLNTDAEGRLILGDALTYAERYEPRLVVDVATLTGAAQVAVGKRASVVMTTSLELEHTIRTLGEVSGDYVWPLPLWDEYLADLKSDVADIANVAGPGPSAKSGGGCIAGGIFLKEFAKKFPQWAHLDIAPRMESIPEDNLAKGSSGAPIRLLVRLIETY